MMVADDRVEAPEALKAARLGYGEVARRERAYHRDY
jgi:hypothetical protein